MSNKYGLFVKRNIMRIRPSASIVFSIIFMSSISCTEELPEAKTAAGGDATGASPKCEQDSDCPDDGDLCNGVMFCDTSKTPHSCAVKPNSRVPDCPDGADTVCSKNTCAPKTAKCEMTPVEDGSKCGDGDACTDGDGCKGGRLRRWCQG